MFVQLNPDVDSYSETISTLKFAERVSGVELGAAQTNREGRDIRELMEQVSFFSLPLLIYMLLQERQLIDSLVKMGFHGPTLDCNSVLSIAIEIR